MRLVVIGDVMLDVEHEGLADGGGVVRDARARARLGGAGRAAWIARRSLRIETCLLAATGTDAAGTRIARLCDQHDLGYALARRPGLRTLVRHRLYAGATLQARWSRGRLTPAASGELRQSLCALRWTPEDVLLVSDYAQGTWAPADYAWAIEHVTQWGARAVVDTKRPRLPVWRGATAVLANHATLGEPALALADPAAWPAWARYVDQWRQELGTTVVLTCGAHGLMARDDRFFVLPSAARSCRRDVGAGDALAVGLAAQPQRDFETALERASALAGLYVETGGPPDPAAVRARWRHRRDWMGAEAPWVATNGCFDFLHPGHVDFLRRAAALGPLIVLVNDDAGVRALKGEDRPLVPLARRLAALRALPFVTRAVPFTGTDPTAAIAALQPRYLVKGVEYRDQVVLGAAEVRAAGGAVRFLPHRLPVSTTAVHASLV